MGEIKNDKIENLIEEENKTETYTAEEAERIRQEKMLIYGELHAVMKEKKGILNFVNLLEKIFKEVFGDLPDIEKEKHIFIHVFAGSSIKQESIYDERDRKAEEMLKEELEKLKAKKSKN